MSKSKTIENNIDKEILDNIRDLYKNTSKKDEFEFLFFNRKNENKMNSENFIKVLEYLKYKSKKQKLKLETSTALDITYSIKINDKIESFRVSINGLKLINRLMEMLHQRKNHVIFSILLSLSIDNKNIVILRKSRDEKKIIDIDNLELRLKVSKEEIISDSNELQKMSEIDHTDGDKIVFRYKQRTSLYVYSDKSAIIKVDLTNINMSNNINKLQYTPSLYELEIDTMVLNPKDTKPLSIIYEEITVLIKILQQSNYITTKTMEKEVLNMYADLLSVNKSKMMSLAGRKPESLEIRHAVTTLPNKYAVTDKADGDRYFLIIYENQVYLISNNLKVKNTGIVIKDSKFNKTILDGEYIFIKSQNRHVFLIFDCLYYGEEDIRQTVSFTDRLEKAMDVVDKLFVFKGQNGYSVRKYDGKFNIDSILKYYDSEITKYMDILNKDIAVEKGLPLIRTKLFLPAMGGQDNEIFKYSELIYRRYVLDSTTKCPYILDGLMYHPLEQKYAIKDTKYVEYKWKPPDKNSIDFYVMFEKNRSTKKILELYDNSHEDFARNKIYRIANLYVGKMGRTGEQPVLFQRDKKKYICNLFVVDGAVRDIEGNIIKDRTIVEFYYNNDPNIPETHRWVPIRTRHDKTERVHLFKRGYGNYIDIANKIWRSMENPFLLSDIRLLMNDSGYIKHKDVLSKKIGHSDIMTERQENAYYQLATNLAMPMRRFHHFIKSNTIYTQCEPRYEDNKHMNIFDIAVGRGGELPKYYYVRANFVVGVDIDLNGITSPTNGAFSRYKQYRRKYPRFPFMTFIHSDAGIKINYEEQRKALGKMTTHNKELLFKFTPQNPIKRMMYDRISCQFAFHYFLKDQISLDNVLENINGLLKPGGQLLITCFDAQKVIQLLKGKPQYTSYYTNKNGEQNVLFEIVKKYDEKLESDKAEVGVGHAIDIFNATFQTEDSYITEYLVDKNYLKKMADKKADLELIETGLFGNHFNNHKDFFDNYIKYESVAATRKALSGFGMMYKQNTEELKASLEFSKLNRFYVFRKRDDPKLTEKLKVNKTVGNIKLIDFENDLKKEREPSIKDVC